MVGQEWFTELYHKSYPTLVQAVYAVTADLEIAEQLTREAFVIAFSRRRRVAAAADPESRVRAIALRLARKHRGEDPPDTDDPAYQPPEAGEPPEVDTITRLARQRTFRRRTITGGAAALVLVLLAVPFLRTQLEPKQHTRLVLASPTADRPGDPSQFSTNIQPPAFADSEHGYALLDDPCQVRADGASYCTKGMVATEDGGQSWRHRPLPRKLWSSGGLAHILALLGPQEVVLDNEDGRWFYSANGGRDWRAVPLTPQPKIRSIPQQAALTGCYLPGDRCADDLLVIQPGSGRPAVLANAPDLDEMAPGPIPTADGTWWVAGTAPETGRLTLAVSSDAGQTWTAAAVPELDSEGFQPPGLSVASGPGGLYALARGYDDEASQPLAALYHSTDGGATWQQTRSPAERLGPLRVAGGLIATDDGRLLLTPSPLTDPANTRRWYESSDHGRTVVANDTGRPAEWVGWTRGGYVAGWISAPAGEPGTYWLSADGTHWRPFTVDW